MLHEDKCPAEVLMSFSTNLLTAVAYAWPGPEKFCGALINIFSH